MQKKEKVGIVRGVSGRGVRVGVYEKFKLCENAKKMGGGGGGRVGSG